MYCQLLFSWKNRSFFPGKIGKLFYKVINSNLYLTCRKFKLFCHIYFRDPHSGIASVSICLGRTRYDCSEMDWSKHEGNDPIIMQVFKLQDGVRTWVRLRATNNGRKLCYLSCSIIHIIVMSEASVQ